MIICQNKLSKTRYLFVLVCVFFSSFALKISAQNNTQTLIPNNPVQSEIESNQIHKFQITIPANHFLLVNIERKGVELSVKLSDSEGNNILEVFPTFNSSGLDSFAYISKTGGIYILESEARNSGKYSIEIDKLKLAGETEKLQVNAFEDSNKGRELYDEFNPEQMPELLNIFQNARDNWRKSSNKIGEASALQSLGGVSDAMGMRRQALEFYAESLALWGELKIETEMANTLDFISYTNYRMSNFQEAFDNASSAFSLFEKIGDESRQAGMLMLLGNIFADLGDTELALDHYEKARQRYIQQKNFHRVAGTLNNIGLAHRDAGDEQKAFEFYTRSLKTFREDRPNTRGEANVLNQLGFYYLKQQDLPNALRYFNEALPIWKRITDAFGEPVTLLGIGRVYAQMGDLLKALDNFEQSLEVAKKRGAKSVEASVLFELAKLEKAQGNFINSREKIETAIEIIEDIRTSILSQQFRAAYFSDQQDFYEFYINLLMQMHKAEPKQGFDIEAFETNERAKARSLVELLAESRADIRKGISSGLLQREKDLQQRINAAEDDRYTMILWKRPTEQVEKADANLRKLIAEYRTLQAEIRRQSPRYAILTQPEPLELAEIQNNNLDKDTLLLEFALGEEKSFVWVISQQGIKSFELPNRSVIETTARRFHESLKDKNRVAESLSFSKELSRIILTPILSELKQKRLLIVTDGVLQYIPFASLQIDGSGGQQKFLIENHEIITLPSATTLATLRREIPQRKSATKEIAVIADPVFSKDDLRVKSNKGNSSAIDGKSNSLTNMGRSLNFKFPRLPGTRKEAFSILSLTDTKRSQQFLDFEANREHVLDNNLQEFKIIHFATHGVVNSQNPELSGVVLSLVDENGQPQAGFLRLHEVYNLELNAELVVLSACETGLGKNIRGEGMIGLTRGFMYAGSPRIVVSLWQVDDRATNELMKYFYKELFSDQKPTAGQALRSAQISMLKRKRWSSPFYWSAFTLQGDWK